MNIWPTAKRLFCKNTLVFTWMESADISLFFPLFAKNVFDMSSDPLMLELLIYMLRLVARQFLKNRLP